MPPSSSRAASIEIRREAISAVGEFIGLMITAVGSAIIVFVVIAVVFVERLLFVEDAAFFGAPAIEELVVDGAFLPCHLLLGPREAKN